MPESSSLGGCTCLVPGGVPAWSWGVYLPGLGGTCLVPGGVPAWSGEGGTCLVQGVDLPGPGGCVPALLGGCTCLVQYLVRYSPLWTEWHTLLKILPCPKLRLRVAKISCNISTKEFRFRSVLLIGSYFTGLYRPRCMEQTFTVRQALWTFKDFFRLLASQVCIIDTLDWTFYGPDVGMNPSEYSRTWISVLRLRTVKLDLLYRILWTSFVFSELSSKSCGNNPKKTTVIYKKSTKHSITKSNGLLLHVWTWILVLRLRTVKIDLKFSKLSSEVMWYLPEKHSNLKVPNTANTVIHCPWHVPPLRQSSFDL